MELNEISQYIIIFETYLKFKEDRLAFLDKNLESILDRAQEAYLECGEDSDTFERIMSEYKFFEDLVAKERKIYFKIRDYYESKFMNCLEEKLLDLVGDVISDE